MAKFRPIRRVRKLPFATTTKSKVPYPKKKINIGATGGEPIPVILLMWDDNRIWNDNEIWKDWEVA